MTDAAPTPTPTPWLAPLELRLRAALAAQRFPHALLLHADSGTGGEALATWTARLLLCRSGEERPCGQCIDCRRVREDQHPDLLWIAPTEDSKQIRVDQIRELGAALALTSHGRGYKVAILAPADALNPNAANALLKTLEEPADGTALILVAADPSRLAATVRSRCQRLRVVPPDRAASLRWLEARRPGEDWTAALELLGNAPFTALDSDVAALAGVRAEALAAIAAARRGDGDPAATAEKWSRGDTASYLRGIENWISERIRAQAAPMSRSVESRAAPHLSDSGPELKLRGLFRLLDQTRELVALLDTPVNRALGIENLLRSFRNVARAAKS